MASFLSMFLSLLVLSRLPSTLSLPTAPSMGLRQADIDANADLASTPWILEDEYSGSNFINGFYFWSEDDPTHGLVDYVTKEQAVRDRLWHMDQKSNEVVLKVDDLAELPLYVPRSSVRIHSYKQYDSGLFILDVSHVPTGCATWPAFWMNGPDPWPSNGEVDIMESVNGNTRNQMTLHTGEGCQLNSPGVYSGTALTTNCLSGTPDSRGCSVLSATNDTVGPGFNQNGGGVYALHLDSSGIQIWTFGRMYIPQDIYTASPNPALWGQPDAFYSSTGCTPAQHFRNMTMIFDITLCGDWAGDKTAWEESKCPGTCVETVMSGLNFREAFFSIRSLRVFQPSVNGSWYDPPSNSGANFTTSAASRQYAPLRLLGFAPAGGSSGVGDIGLVLAAWLCCAVQIRFLGVIFCLRLFVTWLCLVPSPPAYSSV